MSVVAPRFVVRGTDEDWTASIEHPRELADRITPELFAAFLKCFRGADQLLSLEHLLVAAVSQWHEDSIPRSRNGITLFFLTLSTMREVGKALQELCWARVVEKISDRTNWTPLDALRKQWFNNELINSLRNQVGFHLGDSELYRDGLAKKLEGDGTLVFERGEGAKRHDGQQVLATDVLFAGMDLQDDQVSQAMKWTRDGHEQLPELLFALWYDVLTTAGVEVVRE